MASISLSHHSISFWTHASHCICAELRAPPAIAGSNAEQCMHLSSFAGAGATKVLGLKSAGSLSVRGMFHLLQYLSCRTERVGSGGDGTSYDQIISAMVQSIAGSGDAGLVSCICS